jgi:hypothetical protein
MVLDTSAEKVLATKGSIPLISALKFAMNLIKKLGASLELTLS